MIVLKVKDYCHDCPNFECKCTDERHPEMRMNMSSFMNEYKEVTVGDIIITCENSKSCERIEQYLKERLKND